MPKLLTMIGLILAVLIAIPFLLDLALEIPFKRASVAMDVVFLVCSVVLAYLSWTTLKEQV